MKWGPGQLYFQRQSLWELGPEAEAWLTELIHRRPARSRPDVEACFTLLQDYGPAALRRAFAWGTYNGAVGAEYVHTGRSGPSMSTRRSRPPRSRWARDGGAGD